MLPNIYAGNYKVLIIFPLALLLLSLFFIPRIEMGVDFKGGVLITIQLNESIDAGKLGASLKDAGFKDAVVRSFKNPVGYVVEISLPQDENLRRAESLKSEFFSKADEVSRIESDFIANRSTREEYEKARGELNGIANEIFAIAGSERNASSYESITLLERAVSENYRKVLRNYENRIIGILREYIQEPFSPSIDSVSASLSSKFIDKAIGVVFWSSVFAIFIVFIFFRTLIPSLAVLIGAASDVLIALGAMGLFRIPLTLASFAALLMLIGFSLDTDILLTTRVIRRREGTARERAFDSMKTGMTMSLAALLAFSVLFILASITRIAVYYEISAVAIAGLIGDLIATWGLNAVIILSYMEGKEGILEKSGISVIR